MKRILLPGLAILLVIALVLTGFNVSVSPKENTFTLGDIPTLRIGFGTDVYAAPTLDYTISGNADDEFQAAVNALPATGGRIEAMSGTYTFAATVSRAIPGVIIQGQGESTVFNHDGVTALFSAGAQSGWQFRDFKTDAGGITVTAASKWVYSNITIGSTLYTTYSDLTTGSTFPSTPFTGMQFLQNVTGRKILYAYDGSNWQPIRGFGSITIYVDTSGTDDLNHGTGTGTNAFDTVQYAVNMLPPMVDGNVDIYLGAGSFAENVVFQSKDALRGVYSVRFWGTLTKHDDIVMDGNGVQGTGANQSSVHEHGMTANHYQNQLIKFTSGANNGTYRVIDSNSDDGGTANIILCGEPLTAQPLTNDTATVYTWGTTITSIDIGRNSNDVSFYGLKFSSTCAFHVFSLPYFNYCSLYSFTIQHSKVWSYNSLYTGASCCVLINDGANFSGNGNKFYSDLGGAAAVYCYGGGVFNSYGGNVIDNGTYGVLNQNGGNWNAPSITVYDIIRNCTTGIKSQNHGFSSGLWEVQFSGCGTDLVPVLDTLGASGGYNANVNG